MSVEVLEFKIKHVNGKTIGNIHGEILLKRNLVEQWLESKNAKNIRKKLIEHVEDDDLLPCAVIQNIFVENAYRDMGYGSEALEQWLDDTRDVKYYFLEVDLNEENDIDVEDWFEKIGFQTQDRTISGHPIMIMKGD